jgi:hypothetical protein
VRVVVRLAEVLKVKPSEIIQRMEIHLEMETSLPEGSPKAGATPSKPT